MPVYACRRGDSRSAAEGANCFILLDALGNGWVCVETNLAEAPAELPPHVLEMLRVQPPAHKHGSSAEGADLRMFVADDPEDLARQLVLNTRPPLAVRVKSASLALVTLARQLVLNTRPPSEQTLPPTWIERKKGKVLAACAVILDYFPLGAVLGMLLGAFLGGLNALALVAWALRGPEHPLWLLVLLPVGVPVALAGAIVGAVLGALLGIVLGANRVLDRLGRP